MLQATSYSVSLVREAAVVTESHIDVDGKAAHMGRSCTNKTFPGRSMYAHVSVSG
jgi:hypothetical protein